MRKAVMASLLLLEAALTACPAVPRAVAADAPRAVPADPMEAVRADRWADAATAAAGSADPVAEKLVTWFRLSAPSAAGAAEIAAFMAQNPDWPNQDLLEKRRQEALATESDPSVLARECARAPLSVPAALLRCAEALPGEAGAALARRAWVNGITDPAAETAFLARFGAAIGPAEQRARFDTLAWTDPAAAQRQVARLEAADRPAALARLALRRDDPAAPALTAALTPRQRDQAPNAAGLFLEHARFLRRADQDAAALALWQARGAEAEATIAPDHAAALWAERLTLARKLLKDGDADGAAALAGTHGPGSTEQVADAEFLAGFIKLRRLNDPAEAERHFRTLAGLSKAALTQSRAQYWLARAQAAQGQDATAAYLRAAEWPMTFYGQLALLALHQDPAPRIRALRDPAFTREQVLNLTGRELARAALRLAAWGEPRRAHAFVLRLDELTPSPADRALSARLALALGMPDMAVFVARRMGRDGLVLPETGWPMPFEPPTGAVDPALALGVMRQESSFDVAALSPSGARGLMQLMPATAQTVAERLGEPTSQTALTTDPAHNMRLGTAYLREVLDQFAGSVPLAVAAYNAGPHRVTQWLADNGDPRGTAPEQMIDWIELIPINETRNYVQRVLENTVVYAVRLNQTSPFRLAQWTH